MRITKYHGLGNDFIITTVNEVKGKDLSVLSREVCDRHTGIGADGLIVVKEDQLEMVYFNSDGSRAKMCGNGIRCFGKFIYDEGINVDDQFEVKTLAGIMNINVISREPYRCEVNMGKPDYTSKHVPVDTTQTTFKKQDINVLDKTFNVTSMLLGATHSVIEINDLDLFNVKLYGEAFTKLDLFPESTNANFYQVINEQEVKLQTFERGAGLTLACGTGASAVAAHLINEKRVSNPVSIHVELGTLLISQDGSGNIIMNGPAKKILDGEFGD